MQFLYNIGCRDCLNGEERHSYILQNGDKNIYLKKTEFEVKTLIEKWRKEDNHKCRFCTSKNVEVLDVSIEGYPLYNFNRLVRESKYKKDNLISDESIFEIRLDKSNSQITIEVGGEQVVHKDFLKVCFLEILNTINQFPNEVFKSHIVGDFFISLSGGFNFKTHVEEIKVQRCRIGGISKEDILTNINILAEKYGILLDFEKKNNLTKKKWWQF